MGLPPGERRLLAASGDRESCRKGPLKGPDPYCLTLDLGPWTLGLGPLGPWALWRDQRKDEDADHQEGEGDLDDHAQPGDDADVAGADEVAVVEVLADGGAQQDMNSRPQRPLKTPAMDIMVDSGRSVREWRQAMNQFAIAFGDRFTRYVV